MAKNKKNSKTVDIWADDQLAERPARNNAAVGLSERWVRILRTYLKVSVWAFPVTALLLVSIYSQSAAPLPKVSHAITNQVDSAGKSAAIIALNAWLTSVPAPIVGGSVVSWNGFDTEAPTKVPAELSQAVVNPTYSIETQHFTLVDSVGQQYSSDVAVATDKAHGAKVIGSPSLNPIAPSADGWTTGTWFGLKTEAITDPVTVSINQWAKAFTSGDPAVLRSVVRDPSNSHSYMPLIGVSNVKAAFVQGGSVPVIDASGKVSTKPAATIIAQVRLQLTWSTDPKAGDANTASSDKKGDSQITYDLLINEANTATPVVVSWGGAGSGTHLKPYDQAILNRSLTTENK